MKHIIKLVIAAGLIITASSAHSQSWFPAKNLNAFIGTYEGGGYMSKFGAGPKKWEIQIKIKKSDISTDPTVTGTVLLYDFLTLSETVRLKGRIFGIKADSPKWYTAQIELTGKDTKVYGTITVRTASSGVYKEGAVTIKWNGYKDYRYITRP